MSKLQELIDRLCPEGVEFVKLNTLGTFENIGVDKKTVPGEPLVKLLNYVDVYKNKYINKEIPQMTVSSPQKKLDSCSIKQWDIFVTPTSETHDDIGHSAVSTEDIDGAVYSYHIMRFRLNNPNRVTACFINYLFDSQEVQKQIFKFASGLTRFGLSKYKFGDIVIPFPPLEVQDEIVKILDRFSDYAAELQAELQARKEQYEYYRNLLLTFNPSAYGCGTDDAQKISVIARGGHSYEIQWKTMGEICYSLNTGLNPRQFFKLNTPDATGYYVTIREIRGGRIMFNDNTDRINNEGLKLCNNRSNLEKGDVLFSGTGTIGQVAVITETPTNWNIKEGVYSIKPNQELVSSFFLRYILESRDIKDAIMKKVAGGTVKSIPMAELKNILIPIPPLELQEKIVAVLDRFETLVNDLSKGLPAEIEAVKARYEYYRNKLLTFNPLSA